MDDGLREAEAEAEALAAEVTHVTGWTTRVESDAGSFSVTVETIDETGDQTWSLYDWFDWGAWQPRIGRVPGWPEARM